MSTFRPYPIAVCRRLQLASRLTLNLAGAALFVLCGTAAGARPLGFDEALRMAEAQAPALTAQRSAIAAAEAGVERAPRLPDPQLAVAIDSLPLSGPERFSLRRDAMTMQRVGVMQAFPAREKRRLRAALASATLEVERVRLVAARAEVRRGAAAAWIDLHYAERERDLLAALAAELELQIEVAQAIYRGGRGSAVDVLAAKAARVLFDERVDRNQRDLTQAQAALTRWIAEPAEIMTDTNDSIFNVLQKSFNDDSVIVERQPELLPYAARAAAADLGVALARAEKRPDWSVELAYGRRGSAFADLLSLEFRIDLPLFPAHRQDAGIAASLAEAEQRAAEREDARRRQRERTARALADWHAADRSAHRIANTLEPLAEQRTALALAAYRGGSGAIEPLLAARSALVEARLALIIQERARAQAWAELQSLRPMEETP